MKSRFYKLKFKSPKKTVLKRTTLSFKKVIWNIKTLSRILYLLFDFIFIVKLDMIEIFSERLIFFEEKKLSNKILKQ